MKTLQGDLEFVYCVFVWFFRRVQTESTTGSVSSNKVRTTLAIAVEGIEFDTQACMLRIKGRNVEENQYVKVQKHYFISTLTYLGTTFYDWVLTNSLIV